MQVDSARDLAALRDSDQRAPGCCGSAKW
eukprot:SAG11_NODE_24534_length_372_cov_0.553114_1_plen_28_part_01